MDERVERLRDILMRTIEIGRARDLEPPQLLQDSNLASRLYALRRASPQEYVRALQFMPEHLVSVAYDAYIRGWTETDMQAYVNEGLRV